MAYIYFGSGHYALAASSINKILNDTDENIRQDIYAFARILNLIIHYELGNRELLEYIVKSTYRFLHRRNRLYKSEQLIVAFVQKEIPAVISKKDELDAFRKLKKEFQKRRGKMLSDKINVTAFFGWLIDNYPGSIKELEQNPAIQYQFR